MQVVDSITGIRSARATLTGRVGLTPTMGALHDGHLELVRHARRDCDHVIATIFVNPTQFGPGEDLDAYPRDLPGDLNRLEAAGVDLVFTPTPALMYPPGYQTYVTVEQATQPLEGERRPGHFRGVTTVVSKLFNLTQPQVAYFGQKDAQQVVVLRRMTADLNIPVEIVVVPTVREADGLAMSSRNAYLTPEQRHAAVVLNEALAAAGRAYEQGGRHPEALRGIVQAILAAEPLAEPEYVSVTDPFTLQELDETTETPLLLSIVVRFGRARLLDNRLLPTYLNDRAGLTATLGAITETD